MGPQFASCPPDAVGAVGRWSVNKQMQLFELFGLNVCGLLR